MTDQNLTPRSDDIDDTEGHFRRDDQDVTDDTDDTEGHFRRDDQDVTDDTEGHFRR